MLPAITAGGAWVPSLSRRRCGGGGRDEWRTGQRHRRRVENAAGGRVRADAQRGVGSPTVLGAAAHVMPPRDWFGRYWSTSTVGRAGGR